jgi:hydroxyacylglutathione hydrolase
MKIKVTVVPVGPLQMNSVLLSADGPDGPEAILIDPGADPQRLLGLIEESGCVLTSLLATHGHFDHVEGAAEIQKIHDLPLRCHLEDQPIIELMQKAQSSYGLPVTALPNFHADLEDGGSITFAGMEISITHVPGHSPGQLMFRIPGYAIVGDCLFAGSVGRTDLPGGDFPTLEKSIRESIYTLDDATVVVCGHGPDTTVGRERQSNPFVRD